MTTYKLRAEIYHIALKLLWFFYPNTTKTATYRAKKISYKPLACLLNTSFFALKNTLALIGASK